MVNITKSVLLPDDLYIQSMQKASDNKIFQFSKLVRKLLEEYTADEAKLRISEKE